MLRKKGREIYKTVKDQRVVNANGRSGRKRTIIWWDDDKSYANQINGDGSYTCKLVERRILCLPERFNSFRDFLFIFPGILLLYNGFHQKSSYYFCVVCYVLQSTARQRLFIMDFFILLFSDDNNNSYTNVIWLVWDAPRFSRHDFIQVDYVCLQRFAVSFPMFR